MDALTRLQKFIEDDPVEIMSKAHAKEIMEEIWGLHAELAAARERAERLETDRREAVENAEAIAAERDEARTELAAERERYAFLAETNENLRRSMEANIQFWRSSERDALRAALVKAGEALEPFANSNAEPTIARGVYQIYAGHMNLARAAAALTEIRKLTGENDDD